MSNDIKDDHQISPEELARKRGVSIPADNNKERVPISLGDQLHNSLSDNSTRSLGADYMFSTEHEEIELHALIIQQRNTILALLRASIAARVTLTVVELEAFHKLRMVKTRD